MGIPFEQTQMGHKYYEYQLPTLIRELEKFSENIEVLNKNIEKLSSLSEGNEEMQEEMQTISLTDSEQRLFLAAIQRERDVCFEVDEEARAKGDTDVVNLVNVCNSIERKVKSALWER